MSQEPISEMDGDSHSQGEASASTPSAHISPEPSNPSPEPSEVNSPLHDQTEPEDSESASDVDAEGTEDDDYPAAHAATNGHASSRHAPTPSVSSSSDEAKKRKSTFADEDYAQLDPDLYGLRRSVRKKQIQPYNIYSSANIAIRDALDLNAQWYVPL